MNNSVKLIKIDKNGTKYYEGLIPCDRCGGKGGSESWKFTGWTCYKCNGSGVMNASWKEYTPEYEAKLNARRLARANKKHEAELEEAKANAKKYESEFFESNGFNNEGFTWIVLGDTYSIKEELKSKGAKFNSYLGWHFNHEESNYKLMMVSVEEVAERNVFYKWNYKDDAYEVIEKIKKSIDTSNSEFFGEINQKVKDLKVKLVSNAMYYRPSYSRWRQNETEPVYVYTFEDEKENLFVWKTAGFDQELLESNGEMLTIDFTIKDHNEYKGKKQTIIKRVKYSKQSI